jgi:hypothetical protein
MSEGPKISSGASRRPAGFLRHFQQIPVVGNRTLSPPRGSGGQQEKVFWSPALRVA